MNGGGGEGASEGTRFTGQRTRGLALRETALIGNIDASYAPSRDPLSWLGLPATRSRTKEIRRWRATCGGFFVKRHGEGFGTVQVAATAWWAPSREGRRKRTPQITWEGMSIILTTARAQYGASDG